MALGSGQPVPYALAARSLLRDTLLDGARSLLRDRPWAKVTMAEIARAAGVSRQTLYNEFGSREEFAQAFVLREGERFLIDVEAAIGQHSSDPKEALRAAFDVFLSAAAQDPLVRAVLFDGDGGGMLPLVTTQGMPLLESSVQRLSEIIATTWPSLERADIVLVAECMVRLGISYATLPAGPAAMTANSVTELIGPFLLEALSRSE